MDGTRIVRIENCFDTDINDLWSLLTEPDRLARWLGKAERELRAGGDFRATFDASGWQGTGHVQVCESPHVACRLPPGMPMDQTRVSWS